MALPPTIAVFGASGLIGSAIAHGLLRRGFQVVAVARRFTTAQQASFPCAIEVPVTSVAVEQLADLITKQNVDILVNCVGALQLSDTARDAIDRDVVVKLLAAMAAARPEGIFAHVSMPGNAAQDETMFSRSKHAAEVLIAASPVAHIILRPGFVVAPNAYGGSALLRALAALPFDLPPLLGERPLAVVAVEDITETIALAARRWTEGARFAAHWDLMEERPGTVSDVVEAFRRQIGGPARRIGLPALVLRFGAKLGDLGGWLGWLPPVRSTALAEMRRGVSGDPAAWIAATGIRPKTAAEAIGVLPPSVQERWFARLFLLKPVLLAALGVFWFVSGLLPLTLAHPEAAGLLIRAGLPASLAGALTVATSLLDIGIALGIAWRQTARPALVAGIGLSLAYLVGATVILPELWADPLGPLTKIVPATMLMLVALAILEAR